MTFEWDDRKNSENIRKHGIDFHDVPTMFSYPMVVFLDSRREYGEDRWIGIGLLETILAVVAFTEPTEDRIRIISARKATKHEERIYEEEISH